jgi:hypothetical protein
MWIFAKEANFRIHQKVCADTQEGPWRPWTQGDKAPLVGRVEQILDDGVNIDVNPNSDTDAPSTVDGN